MVKPESYPFLRIAKEYNIDYGTILLTADWRRSHLNANFTYGISKEIDIEIDNYSFGSNHSKLKEFKIELQSILSEGIPDDWVSVEDGLPEEGTEVCVYIHNSYTGTAIYQSVGVMSQFVNENYDVFDSGDVTHWKLITPPSKQL